MKLNVSAGLIYSQNPREVGSNATKEIHFPARMSVSRQRRTEETPSSSLSLILDISKWYSTD